MTQYVSRQWNSTSLDINSEGRTTVRIDNCLLPNSKQWSTFFQKHRWLLRHDWQRPPRTIALFVREVTGRTMVADVGILKYSVHRRLKLKRTQLSYSTSLAIWYHTVLPANRHKWTRPAYTPARKAGTRLTYPGEIGGWFGRGCLHTKMVYLPAYSHPSSKY